MSKKKIDILEQPKLRQACASDIAAHPSHVAAMTTSQSRNSLMGTADRRPMVYREGALDAMQCPSRMNNRLHYRDGRVEHI